MQLKSIANHQDFKLACNILTEAYKEAPNLSWVLPPNPKTQLLFFQNLLHEVTSKNGAYLTHNKQGILLLYNMTDKSKPTVKATLKKLRLVKQIGLTKSFRLLKLESLKQSIRPRKGLYGIALAIADNKLAWQTRLELKQGFKEIQQTLQLPIYVETTNERIMKLYQTIGFTTYHTMKHPYTDLTIWFMELN